MVTGWCKIHGYPIGIVQTTGSFFWAANKAWVYDCQINNTPFYS